jgi:protein-S-isoprenylcysteine O-methyltransferase Ste14
LAPIQNHRGPPLTRCRPGDRSRGGLRSYAATISICLRKQSRRLGLEPRERAERRHQSFHRWALRLQNLDGIAFGSLCLASMSTLAWESWIWPSRIIGAALIAIGMGTKAWAVRCLGMESYTWHDFFVPKEKLDRCRTGPYRWFSDPMYTVGYLQAYGIALALCSWHGFAASLIAQSSILLVNEFVEKPHFRRLCAVAERPKNASRSRMSWNH